MAVRADEAIRLSLRCRFLFVFSSFLLVSKQTGFISTEHSYFSSAITTLEFILTFTFSILPEILCTPVTTGGSIGPAKRCQWQRETKQKRGKRAGFRARLKANPIDELPPASSSQTAGLSQTVDELRMRTAQQCVTIITETWLNHNVPEAAIVVASCSVYSWCTHADIVYKLCCPDLELLMVRCRFPMGIYNHNYHVSMHPPTS